jgi:hypothetical protein
MGALHDSPLGLGLVRTPLTARSRLMRNWLSGDYSVPVAFFDVRPEFNGEFLTDFTYEMAHNNPLDVAVFGAYAQAWQRERNAGHHLDIAPPVLFAPVEEPGVVFEDARIGTRVGELISRLGRLPGNVVMEAPIHNADALGFSLKPWNHGAAHQG